MISEEWNFYLYISIIGNLGLLVESLWGHVALLDLVLARSIKSSVRCMALDP